MIAAKAVARALLVCRYVRHGLECDASSLGDAFISIGLGLIVAIFLYTLILVLRK